MWHGRQVAAARAGGALVGHSAGGRGEALAPVGRRFRRLPGGRTSACGGPVHRLVERYPRGELGVRGACERGELEGLAAQACLSDELLQDHLLRALVGIVLVQHSEHVSSEYLVGHRLASCVEAGPEEVLEFLPHRAFVRVFAVVHDCYLLVEFDELRLVQDAVLLEVLDTEELSHEAFEPVPRL